MYGFFKITSYFRSCQSKSELQPVTKLEVSASWGVISEQQNVVHDQH